MGYLKNYNNINNNQNEGSLITLLMTTDVTHSYHKNHMMTQQQRYSLSNQQSIVRLLRNLVDERNDGDITMNNNDIRDIYY